VTSVPTGPAFGDRLLIAGPEGGGAFTIRVKFRLWVRQPLLPVTVSV
jgi:hypothetical protein